MESTLHSAPLSVGDPVLGRTLVSLLDEACEKNANDRAFSQLRKGNWDTLSTTDFAAAAEACAAGLLKSGLSRGDKVALFMHSDTDLCVADMACLIAGLVDVPVYLTHAPESISFVLNHSGARRLFVTDSALLKKITPVLKDLPRLEGVILTSPPDDWPSGMPQNVPREVKIETLAQIQDLGRRAIEDDAALIDQVRSSLGADDVATIIYTSGTTGEPKGVMLTHQNISSNVIGAFTALEEMKRGPEDVVISFLPLTHIFARMLQYGFMWYGSSIYYCTPEELGEYIREVRPTVFASVPRVLERVYEKITARGAQLKGAKKLIFNWAMLLARRYRVGERQSPIYRVQLALADRLVFSQWREALGGRTKFIISGGAALSAELTNIFGAAGVTVLQGYGLTETSPVITYNRPQSNRPGTVGQPIAGVEVKISEDGEILTRGPHVMTGYYRNPTETAEVMDKEGWLRTGDIGEMTEEGFLKITDRKKDLFKLSTGKYVIPQPIENRLMSHRLIEQAVVVGEGRKYATALIFPSVDNLRVFARRRGIPDDAPLEKILKHPETLNRFQRLVDQANKGISPWSTVKNFTLIPTRLTIEDGYLTPTMKVRRSIVREHFSDEIDGMYGAGEQQQPAGVEAGET